MMTCNWQCAILQRTFSHYGLPCSDYTVHIIAAWSSGSPTCKSIPKTFLTKLNVCMFFSIRPLGVPHLPHIKHQVSGLLRMWTCTAATPNITTGLCILSTTLRHIHLCVSTRPQAKQGNHTQTIYSSPSVPLVLKPSAVNYWQSNGQDAQCGIRLSSEK